MAFKMKGNPMGRNFGIGKHGINIKTPNPGVKRDEGNTDLSDGRSGSSPFQKKGGYSDAAKNLLKAVPNKAAYDKLSDLDKKGFDRAAKAAGIPQKKVSPVKIIPGLKKKGTKGTKWTDKIKAAGSAIWENIGNLDTEGQMYRAYQSKKRAARKERAGKAKKRQTKVEVYNKGKKIPQGKESPVKDYKTTQELTGHTPPYGKHRKKYRTVEVKHKHPHPAPKKR